MALTDTFAAHSTEKVGSRSTPFHGASTSSTWWPSSSSSAAVSRAACSYWGSSSDSTGRSKVSAIRSLPGSRAASSANGASGGVAQVASPGS